MVIVAIDADSSRHLGLPAKPRNWPREMHAQLVAFLASAGAKVVSFDLTFDTPSPRPEADQAFAKALQEAGNVLVTDALRRQTIRLEGADGKSQGTASIERLVPPIPELEHAVLAHAPFLLPKGPRVDAYWTFRSSAGDVPTVPVLAFSFYASAALDNLASLVEEAHLAGPLPVPHERSAAWVPPAGSVKTPGIRDQVQGLREAVLAVPRASQTLLQRLDGRAELPPERRRLVESLIGLYTAGELSYLNFFGPAGSIRTVPYFKVLEAARSEVSADRAAMADLFKGKAVFVGFSPSDGGEDPENDDYRTVYSDSRGRDISGVEIQATAFANAFAGRPLTPAPAGLQSAAVAAWGLLLGVLCRRIRPMRALAAAAAAAALLAWIVYREFAADATWWPLIVPLAIQLPTALFSGVFLNYLETQREREAVKKAFGQFLPSAVVDQLERSIGPVTARNRVVFGSCLSTDAEKYTTLAEQTEPGKLGELMNAYYADLFVPVERTGGIVIDVVGDAMVAIWVGAGSEAELRIGACDSALTIVAALDRAAAEGRTVLPTRLGLHSGQMLVGSIGASRHYEYRAVGDIVNTSARIQGLNKYLGTRLLASAETVQGLYSFATRPLGSFLLAGKVTPVVIVELMGHAEGLDQRARHLLEVFAAGLADYDAARFDEARKAFEETLRIHPDDGPAAFYRMQCERLLLTPPPDDWKPTIRVDVK